MSVGEVLLVIDVGNSNTVFGVYRGDELAESFRFSTRRESTADELGALLAPLFARAGIEMAGVDGVAISSVVPPLQSVLEELASHFFHCQAFFIEPGIKTGMPIRYDNPAEVGADRIVNALAGRELFGCPVVVVDFGTATTFDVVNAAGEYVGGIIAPGISISAEALFSRASRLSRVEVRRPAQLVGRNTVGAMQSGLYYGYVALVDGILERLHGELPGICQVVATGGQAELIASESRYIQRVEPLLTLTGLKRIYERNRPRE